ncbi:MAG: leucyl/phenylalanyl-tRNA--protein transferase [Rhodovibrionaceae bacterium]|nr:leucyl/phenylalanyl-tRNA--protein transferase [Rhodovibrionaceae bacterium]
MRLTPELVLRAYALGIFPMAESRDDPDVHWIDPETRGILPLDGFHAPRKLRRRVRRGDFEVRCDHDFLGVIRGCAAQAANRPDTWINETIEKLYSELHAMGFAHSVECWREGRLVGGLYGVSLGAAFFGESMFSQVTDASKVALVHLVARLIKGGFTLLDTQFTTPHLIQFGAMEIPRAEYRERLADAVPRQATFYPELSAVELEEFLQSTIQTS